MARDVASNQDVVVDEADVVDPRSNHQLTDCGAECTGSDDCDASPTQASRQPSTGLKPFGAPILGRHVVQGPIAPEVVTAVPVPPASCVRPESIREFRRVRVASAERSRPNAPRAGLHQLSRESGSQGAEAQPSSHLAGGWQLASARHQRPRPGPLIARSSRHVLGECHGGTTGGSGHNHHTPSRSSAHVSILRPVHARICWPPESTNSPAVRTSSRPGTTPSLTIPVLR